MPDTRRDFLTVLAGASALALIPGSSQTSQTKKTAQQPPLTNPVGEDDRADAVPSKSPTKAVLEANEKDIKKNIEKLYQLATDLKAEVEKTDSSQVLSLALLKKADEIEKLAHDIKIRAKG